MVQAGGGHEAKAFAVGGTIGHAGVVGAFGKLTAGGLQGVGTFAVRLKFPADDLGARIPSAQTRQNFRRRDQFGKQAAFPRGNLFGSLDGFQFAGGGAGEDLAERKIAHSGGVKNGVHLLAGQFFEPRLQIGGGGEGDDGLGMTRTGPGCLHAGEQGDVMSPRHEEVGQFGAEPAGGKIGEPAHVIERFVRRAGGDHAVHAVSVMGGWKNVD